MPLESGLIAYAALANLALARPKHRPMSPLPLMASPAVARKLGVLLLSVLAAMLRFGVAQGVVGWIGQLCVAGAVLVLLMSWRSRVALMLGLPALLVAMLVTLF
jgi:hypothetical protein